MDDSVAGQEMATVVAGLYVELRLSVFAYLSRLVGQADWAEELTQETFLRVYRARERLANVTNRRAWVYRVATNVAHNAWRRRNRFKWLPWRDREQSVQADPGAGVAENMAVERALTALPLRYRVPLLLFSHYGFTVAEIADVLGIGPGAVRTRLYRAREMFRERYEQECQR